MDDHNLDDIIDAYLRQELPDTEAAALDSRIKEDPIFAERVNLRRITFRAMKRLSNQHLQMKLDQWRDEMNAQESQASTIRNRFRTRWILIASGVGLMISIYVLKMYFFNPKPAESPTPATTPIDTLKEPPGVPPSNLPSEKNQIPAPSAKQFAALAEKNLQDYEAKLYSENLRGNTSVSSLPEDVLLDQADSLLKIRQYPNAVVNLEKIPAGSLFRPGALQRLAFAHYKLGQSQLAVSEYVEYSTYTPMNKQEHEWILCMYYLSDYARYQKEFQRDFEKILKDPSHTYNQKAVLLKKQMR